MIFDIYYLASTYDFEGRKLQEAIFETLQNRGTLYERHSLEQIAGLSKDKDIMTRWNAFCKKTLKQQLDFNKVLQLMVSFIKPVYQAILYESECMNIWKAENKAYIKIDNRM